MMSEADRITHMLEDGTKVEIVPATDIENCHYVRITRPSGSGLAMYETFCLRAEEIEVLWPSLQRFAARDHQGDDPT
jgi:hypothetical protein